MTKPSFFLFENAGNNELNAVFQTIDRFSDAINVYHASAQEKMKYQLMLPLIYQGIAEGWSFQFLGFELSVHKEKYQSF